MIKIKPKNILIDSIELKEGGIVIRYANGESMYWNYALFNQKDVEVTF